MTPLGIGSDILEIERIREAYHRHGYKFLEKHFTSQEIAYCQKYADPLPHFAGRFAAKEAIVKALGTGISSEISWLDIEVLNLASGQPEVSFSNRVQQSFRSLKVLITISHCKTHATATAIAMH
ncbi:MAG: holo-ACP synthase [Verrucomicrobia bacterium]|nr:holo-ACP synthase [Verrucomicrobiota bacterium]MBS0647047.1 holo-ACP synthase [Verrucomicrobiota bacterium]